MLGSHLVLATLDRRFSIEQDKNRIGKYTCTVYCIVWYLTDTIAEHRMMFVVNAHD